MTIEGFVLIRPSGGSFGGQVKRGEMRKSLGILTAFAAALLSGTGAGAQGFDEGTVDGFMAAAIVTNDPDWEARWNTPADAAPSFPVVSEMRAGEEAALLVFFANASLRDGAVDLLCNITITRADGVVSTDQRGFPCGPQTIEGSPRDLRMTTLSARIGVAATDPKGTWQIAIRVTDSLRGARVPLRLSLEFLS